VTVVIAALRFKEYKIFIKDRLRGLALDVLTSSGCNQSTTTTAMYA